MESISLSIDVEGVQEALYVLGKANDGDLIKKMREEIKNEPGLQSAMAGITSRIPTVSPLQGNEFGYGGMIHNGRTSYKGATVKPLVTTSVSRLGSRGFSRIVTISTSPPKSGVGFEIIDMVGRGAKGNSPKAEGMKRKLGGSPSRYVWKGFEARQEGVSRAITAIINRYAALVNVKLR